MTMWFFFQAEDGIRDLVRSRGLGDVYKRQSQKGQAPLGGQGLRQQLGMLDEAAPGLPGQAQERLSLIHI